MLSPFEWTIARRYLMPGRGEAFIFMVAGISLVAVMLGVAALIIVMSVMNGFRADLLDRIVGINGHAVVQGFGGKIDDWEQVLEDARNTPRVVSASPLIEQPLLATYNGRVEGIIVRGMDTPDIEALAQNVLAGDLSAVLDQDEAEVSRVAMASRLAESLGLRPGQRFTIINPQGRSTPFGTVPREISYEVSVIFEIGIYDYDKAFVVMPIPQAQQLLLTGNQVGLIEITTEDADAVGEILAPLQASVGSRGVIADWRTTNATLFEALAVERVAMFIVLSIIVLVAVFNILSSLIMLVRAKTRDIAILRTMGASRRSLTRIFIAIGLAIGTLGALAGTGLGFIFLYFRQSVVNVVQIVTGQNLWDPSIRFLSELPSKTDPFEVGGIILLALVLSFLATLYPAFKAANTDPVEVLRYD